MEKRLEQKIHLKGNDSGNNCHFDGERFVLSGTYFILELIKKSTAFLCQGEEDGDSGMISMIKIQMAWI